MRSAKAKVAPPDDVWRASPAYTGARKFHVIYAGEGYVLQLEDVPIRFELRQVRWERGELFARLTVRTSLPGTPTYDGVLGAPSTLNLSSGNARKTRAEHLKSLSEAPQIPWSWLIEELAVRVFEHQDQGEPAVNLATMPDPGDAQDDMFNFYGVTLPSQHNSILFGDGGVMKSFLELAIAANLAQGGLRVAIFDWEMKPRDHRRRLSMMFGPDPLPHVLHVKCNRPLVQECERLRRLVRSEKLDYVFYDSVGYACQGDPATSESALAYFQATNLIGIGGCHLAHITKNGDDNDKRPFGSTFWHNSARCTWNVKLESSDYQSTTAGGPRRIHKVIGLFNRKTSFDDLLPPVGLSVTFENGRCEFAPTSLTTTTELVKNLSLKERMIGVVRHQPQTLAAIAQELGHDNVDTLDRTVRRYKDLFTKITSLDGIQRIALVARRRDDDERMAR